MIKKRNIILAGKVGFGLGRHFDKLVDENIEKIRQELKGKSDHEILAILSKDGFKIQGLSRKNQTIERCKIAVNQQPFSIRYVKNQTVQLCLNLLVNHPKSKEYGIYRFIHIVPNDDHETTLNNLKNKKEILESLNAI